jgi:hypothetical protein
MKVILRHKTKQAWSGIYKYKNCNDYLGTYLTRTGRRYTGLTDEENVRLGKELKQDLHPNSSFWDTFAIRIGAEDVIIDTNDSWGELQYLFLKNHKRVQSSLSTPKATANYVLINKDEEAKEANKVNQNRRKAYKEFDKMSINDMRRCLRLFGLNPDNSSAELIEFKLSEFIDQNPERYIELWVDNKKRDTQFLVESAISKNIIRRNKNIYKYGSDIIGHTLEETIAYIDDPKNQELKRAIVTETEGRPSQNNV